MIHIMSQKYEVCQERESKDTGSDFRVLKQNKTD